MWCKTCKYWEGNSSNSEWGNCSCSQVYDMIETDNDNHPDFNEGFGCIYHKDAPQIKE
jgi:hypothetical protein